MIKPRRPIEDTERVAALHALKVLDTPREERYDRIVRELAERLDVPITYLALLDAERQWLKSMIGDLDCEMDRELSFCSHTILEDQVMIVQDARKDPRFFDNPMVIGEPFIRFYAGIPLTSDGRNVGTLCVADTKPRELGDEDLGVLRAFAGQVEQRLNSRAKIFISYSHQDEEWKDRLLSHLAVLQQQDLLSIWDDRKIGAGDAWHSEIRDAMESSNVAVLLVSANFLTSKFILDVEVPRLLQRRDREGLRIVPLIVKPCCWDRVGWLEAMNMYPRDAQPLSGGSDHEIDQGLAEFAAIVLDKLKQTPGAPGRVPVESPAPTIRSAPSAQPIVDPPSDSTVNVRLSLVDDARSKSETFMFRQSRITIGRDPSCDLPLDEDLRVISGVHAEIAASDNRFFVRDLGSKNFTYLNEEQLEPELLYPLRPGDAIGIGDLEIRVEAISGRQAQAMVEPTTFDPGYVNPFRDDGKLLADVLRRITEAYDREVPSRRDAALQEALGESLGDDAEHPALEVIGRLFANESWVGGGGERT